MGRTAYSIREIREQALAEGHLVDVTKEAREQGFLIPVAIDAKVHQMLTHLPEYGPRAISTLLDTALGAIHKEAERLGQDTVPALTPFTFGLSGERKVWCCFYLIVLPTQEGEWEALTINIDSDDSDESEGEV
jgi:hypothetical protein